MRKLHISLLGAVAAAALATAQPAAAQEMPQALFDYPQAPDTCLTLESRSNYVIAHFWDNFDFGRPITDDGALVKTFRDYADLFKYGHRNVVMSGVRDFMFKLRANSANLSKVGRVAEAVLYGPMADYWSDELYVEFAKSLSAATGLSKDEREYYMRQIGLISACQEGAVLQLDYTDAGTGAKRQVEKLDTVMTIIYFMDDGIDSRMGRTMLDTDLGLNTLIADGSVSVLCLYDGTPPDDWAASVPSTWLKGCAQRIGERIDLRFLPSCFVLDKQHRIVQKNLSVQDLKAALND